jgi:2-polyprenyl-6-methoxyphenol hydroxylase-like FAD-dependent oxidoreductase
MVIGADGRRSTVARLVGSQVPQRTRENGRGLVFAYAEDPKGDAERRTLSQWRVGDTLGNFSDRRRDSRGPVHGPEGRRGAARAGSFARRRRPRQLTSLPRLARFAARALSRPGAARRDVVREVRDELRFDVAEGIDLWRLTRAGRVFG